MQKSPEPKSIEQLMAEADELIRQLNSEIINDMEEAHRLQFEKHAQHLEKIKSKFQGKLDKQETSEIGSGAEGIHEAIQNIVTAFQELKGYLA